MRKTKKEEEEKTLTDSIQLRDIVTQFKEKVMKHVKSSSSNEKIFYCHQQHHQHSSSDAEAEIEFNVKIYLTLQ